MSHPKEQIVYKAKRPIKVVTATPPIKEVTIPAGSVLAWHRGDIAGDKIHLSWLGHRVQVDEMDLFSHCEHVMDDSDLLT